MNKCKKALFIVLSVVLGGLLATSVYVNFIATSASVVTYILMGQMIAGILTASISLLLGGYAYKNKKNHELLLLSFLESLFVLTLIVLNSTQGFAKIVSEGNNYIDYMEYVSFNISIAIYSLFVIIIGFIYLTSFINYKTKRIKK